MAARSCPECLTDWPPGESYRKCPVCLAPTRFSARASAEVSYAEARRRRAHADFERFYAEREEERERRGDPSPEQLGALDARRDHAQILALEEAVEAR